MEKLQRLVIGVLILFFFPIYPLAGSDVAGKEEDPIRWTLSSGQAIAFELELSATEGKYFHFDNQGLDYIYVNINGYEIDLIIDSYYHCEGEFCCEGSTCYMPDDGRGSFDVSEYLVEGQNSIVLMGEGDPGTFAEIAILNGEEREWEKDSIGISGASRPPVFNVPPTPPRNVTLVVDAGSPVIFTVRASGPDAGTTVRLGVNGLPQGASFTIPPPANPVESTFTWTPTSAQVGFYTVTFRAEDNRGLAASPHRVNIRVRVPTNRPPVFNVPPTPRHGSTLTVEVARTLTFTVRASDPDAGATVRLRVIGLPRGASFPIPPPDNPVQSTFAWTPALDQVRTHTVIFTATDSRGLAGRPHRIRIRVRIPDRGMPFFNIPPTPPRRVPIIVDAGATLNFTVTATDPDSPDTVTLSVTGLPEGAEFPIPDPANPVSSDFSWTPGFEQIGSYTVTFTARDNRGLATGPYRLRILVRQPANRRPSFDVPPTPARDTTLNVQLGGTLTFTVQASSPDGNDVTLRASNLPQGASFPIPEPASTVSSELRWTPTAAQIGNHMVVFTARDDQGLASPPHRIFINVIR